MFNIEKFLKKFSKNIEATEVYIKQILEIIEKQTQLKLPIEVIEIKNMRQNIKKWGEINLPAISIPMDPIRPSRAETTGSSLPQFFQRHATEREGHCARIQ